MPPLEPTVTQAAMVNLNAFMRLLRIGAKTQLEPYRARIASLTADVHCHLEAAGCSLADVSKRLRRDP